MQDKPEEIPVVGLLQKISDLTLSLGCGAISDIDSLPPDA